MNKLVTLIFTLLLVTLGSFAQPAKMTAEDLGIKGNELLNANKQREAIALVEANPDLANETSALYILSVAYTELREFDKANIYFQKQFDNFVESANSAVTEADELAARVPATKSDNELASLMYSTSLISFASADLANSLRIVAFEKNGMPEAKRKPAHLEGYEIMMDRYRGALVKAALIQLKTNELQQAFRNANKAVEIGPENPAAYKARAQVYRRLKKVALARADDLKAAKLSKK